MAITPRDLERALGASMKGFDLAGLEDWEADARTSLEKFFRSSAARAFPILWQTLKFCARRNARFW
jgi:hypothetical protein